MFDRLAERWTRLLDPPEEQRPPTLLGIGVAVQMLAASFLIADLEKVDSLRLATFVFQSGCAAAILLMNRWGVVGIAGYTLFTVGTWVHYGLARGAMTYALLGLCVRASVLIPSALFWDRMTWRPRRKEPTAATDDGPAIAPSSSSTSSSPARVRRPGAARMACTVCGELTDVDDLRSVDGERACPSCIEVEEPDAPDEPG
jgi:hypothetical protein